MNKADTKNTPLLYIERDIKFAEFHFGNLPGVKIFSSPKIFIAPTKSGGKLLCASILFGPQRFVFTPDRLGRIIENPRLPNSRFHDFGVAMNRIESLLVDAGTDECGNPSQNEVIDVWCRAAFFLRRRAVFLLLNSIFGIDFRLLCRNAIFLIWISAYLSRLVYS